MHIDVLVAKYVMFVVKVSLIILEYNRLQYDLMVHLEIVAQYY